MLHVLKVTISSALLHDTSNQYMRLISAKKNRKMGLLTRREGIGDGVA